jgi:hypothetical protein
VHVLPVQASSRERGDHSLEERDVHDLPIHEMLQRQHPAGARSSARAFGGTLHK